MSTFEKASNLIQHFEQQRSVTNNFEKACTSALHNTIRYIPDLPNVNQFHLDTRLINFIHINLYYSVVVDPVMSNPGYFTKEGLSGKEADSNNNCQPQDGAKRARMDDSQAGTNQAGSSQASASTSQSSYATYGPGVSLYLLYEDTGHP